MKWCNKRLGKTGISIYIASLSASHTCFCFPAKNKSELWKSLSKPVGFPSEVESRLEQNKCFHSCKLSKISVFKSFFCHSAPPASKRNIFPYQSLQGWNTKTICTCPIYLVQTHMNTTFPIPPTLSKLLISLLGFEKRPK